jgi:MFS family permease
VTERTARRLAWSLFVLFAALAVATAALGVLDRGGDDWFTLLAVGYPLAGALVASRQPRNPVGWLLMTIGIFLALGTLADTNLRSASAPAIGISAWLSEAGWYVWLGCAAVFLPLLFPTGRPPSPRWRPVVWIGVAALVASIAAATFKPHRLDLDTPRQIENPLGIEGAGGFFDAVSLLGDLLVSIAVLLVAASVVVRFRHSRGTERQQLKWFAFAGLIALLGMALAMAQVLFGMEPGDEGEGGWLEAVGTVGWFTTLFAIVLAMPVATGMAILRHRLYDIDVVIRRTLVYTALTATLVASYIGTVLLLQLILSPGSGLAIAASTLAVAALFRPAATRIQRLVDRRFYRRKYDAALTIESFGARVRDEVELDSLSAELRAVAADTMQPAHVSLWLRGASS